MKALIVYATKYGSTEKAAKLLAEKIGADIELLNLTKEEQKDLKIRNYDAIAIGGSIYKGKIQKEIHQFCLEHIDEIMQKTTGIFICCGFEKKSEQQLENAFTQELLNHAVIRGYFGYGFDFSKMDFISRSIIKKLAKIDDSKTVIKHDNIKKFADELVGRH